MAEVYKSTHQRGITFSVPVGQAERVWQIAAPICRVMSQNEFNALVGQAADLGGKLHILTYFSREQGGARTFYTLATGNLLWLGDLMDALLRVEGLQLHFDNWLNAEGLHRAAETGRW